MKDKIVYIETSAFNYINDRLSIDGLSKTKAYQQSVGKYWLVSPVTLWEIMLTTENAHSDALILSAQNLFSEDMLATPSEIIVRYLKYAYPENKVNYSFLSDIPMSECWKKMTKSNSINFQYDKDKLKLRTSIYRQLSKNLNKLLNVQNITNTKTEYIFWNTCNVVYECMLSDGWNLPEDPTIVKLTLLFMILIMVFRLDIESCVIENFWEEKGMLDDDPIKLIKYLTETYPALFFRGPFVEMANMAYHQYQLGMCNRGTILDSLHMIYMPYVHICLTNDDAFKSYKNSNPYFYLRKIFHMDEIEIKAIKL